jgi:ribokinase
MLERHSAAKQSIIVTLGADGVAAAHKGKYVTVKGLRVEPVDTVGAGDTFCGYFAAGLDGGMEFELALRQAAAAGSLACTKPGAQPAIPFLKDVRAAIR